MFLNDLEMRLYTKMPNTVAGIYSRHLISNVASYCFSVLLQTHFLSYMQYDDPVEFR